MLDDVWTPKFQSGDGGSLLHEPFWLLVSGSSNLRGQFWIGQREVFQAKPAWKLRDGGMFSKFKDWLVAGNFGFLLSKSVTVKNMLVATQLVVQQLAVSSGQLLPQPNLEAFPAYPAGPLGVESLSFLPTGLLLSETLQIHFFLLSNKDKTPDSKS